MSWLNSMDTETARPELGTSAVSVSYCSTPAVFSDVKTSVSRALPAPEREGEVGGEGKGVRDGEGVCDSELSAATEYPGP